MDITHHLNDLMESYNSAWPLLKECRITTEVLSHKLGQRYNSTRANINDTCAAWMITESCRVSMDHDYTYDPGYIASPAVAFFHLATVGGCGTPAGLSQQEDQTRNLGEVACTQSISTLQDRGAKGPTPSFLHGHVRLSEVEVSTFPNSKTNKKHDDKMEGTEPTKKKKAKKKPVHNRNMPSGVKTRTPEKLQPEATAEQKFIPQMKTQD
ncbi:hypothetical protein V8F06_002853 [Rhypophila decipiens]